jgi:hypothetical protein
MLNLHVWYIFKRELLNARAELTALPSLGVQVLQLFILPYLLMAKMGVLVY